HRALDGDRRRERPRAVSTAALAAPLGPGRALRRIAHGDARRRVVRPRGRRGVRTVPEPGRSRPPAPPATPAEGGRERDVRAGRREDRTLPRSADLRDRGGGVAGGIEVRGITKRYGTAEKGILALEDVSLSVRTGTIFGLLGPNGAGKTTLIKVLTGLTPVTEGSATVAGFDVGRRPMEVKRRIGWVAAEVILDDDITARENLWLQARLQSLHGWRERSEALLQHFGLTDRADDRVGRYSTG
ncbi:daunorubicin resistance ABC transporter ATPase subunit, partial [mine drainage metagenome]